MHPIRGSQPLLEIEEQVEDCLGPNMVYHAFRRSHSALLNTGYEQIKFVKDMQTQEGYEASESEETIRLMTFAQLAMGVGEHVTARIQVEEAQQILQKLKGRST